MEKVLVQSRYNFELGIGRGGEKSHGPKSEKMSVGGV